MTIYELDVIGCDFDFRTGEWDEMVHEFIYQEDYDTYEDAVEAMRSITPLRALELEKASGCNGLDVVIFERHFDKGEEKWFTEAGYAEWIGMCRNLEEVWEVVK